MALNSVEDMLSEELRDVLYVHAALASIVCVFAARAMRDGHRRGSAVKGARRDQPKT